MLKNFFGCVKMFSTGVSEKKKKKTHVRLVDTEYHALEVTYVLCVLDFRAVVTCVIRPVLPR